MQLLCSFPAAFLCSGFRGKTAHHDAAYQARMYHSTTILASFEIRKGCGIIGYLQPMTSESIWKMLRVLKMM